MKSVWEGSVAFGLVNIPVKLYSAVQPRDIGFKLIDAKTKTPIQYKRWCPVCNEEVPWKDVVKGLEIKRGEYYIFTKDELERLKPEKSSTIEIVEFIDSIQYTLTSTITARLQARLRRRISFSRRSYC
jgi:DNA end-binding protein Ku